MNENLEATEKTLVEKMFPEPTMNFVVVKNPLHERTTQMVNDLQKLPEKDRKDFARREVASLFDKMEIFAVGPEVKNPMFKIGAFAASTMDAASRATGTMKAEYIFMREQDFFGVW